MGQINCKVEYTYLIDFWITFQSFTVPEAPTNRRNQGRNRSHKNGHMDEQLDEALSSVATSLSKLVEAKSSSDDVTNLKFKEFHIELDKILRQMPFLQGMQFCMDMVKQANEVLENGYGNWFELYQ